MTYTLLLTFYFNDSEQNFSTAKSINYTDVFIKKDSQVFKFPSSKENIAGWSTINDGSAHSSFNVKLALEKISNLISVLWALEQ